MPTKDEYRWIDDKGDSELRLNYNLNEDSVVVDLGGFKGDWSALISEKYSCNIHIFEPVREFYLQFCSQHQKWCCSYFC